jgi:succinoglycan biosynthesis transport protein ExoP
MFQMPRGKPGNVDNGFNPRRARVVDSASSDSGGTDSGAAAPVARVVGELDLSFLSRRKWWIAASVAAALVVCFIADLVIPPRYRAAAQILIGPVDLRVVDKDVMPLAQTADANVIQVESETRVLTSDKVLLRVIEGEQLASDPEFRGRGGGGMGGAIAAVLAPLGRKPAGRAEADPQIVALRALKRDVVAVRGERTYVVDLVVETEDADKSARIANAVARAYLDEQSAARTAAARRASDSLIARLSELKSRVQKAEENVQRYKSDNDMVGAGGMVVQEQQLGELNKLLTTARARTADTKARYDQVAELERKGLDAGSTNEGIGSNTIGRLREQYGAAARLEASLSAKLGPRHPDVQDVHAQTRNALRLVTEEIRRIANAYRAEYESALANEKALSARLDGLKRDSMEMSLASVRLRELEREVEASRAVYEAFLVRARETQEQERLDTANVRVISDAQAPVERSWPPRRLVMFAAAGGLGLAGGIGFAGLGEFVRRRS